MNSELANSLKTLAPAAIETDWWGEMVFQVSGYLTANTPPRALLTLHTDYSPMNSRFSEATTAAPPRRFCPSLHRDHNAAKNSERLGRPVRGTWR